METTGRPKAELRSRVLAARRSLTAAQRAAAGAAVLAEALAAPEIAEAETVAAYVSVGTEPATHQLLELLRERGKRVLLPVLLPDADLDWAYYDGASGLGTADRGLLEPSSPRLGVDAVRGADAVVLPAVAVDQRGFRLGRGGGSYDRVLARLDAEAFTAALLHDGEVVEHVPTEDHDRRVHAALTPSGMRRFASSHSRFT